MALLEYPEIGRPVSSFDIASLGLAGHRAYFMSSFSVSLAVGIVTSTM
jgi:hypothetical protein